MEIKREGNLAACQLASLCQFVQAEEAQVPVKGQVTGDLTGHAYAPGISLIPTASTFNCMCELNCCVCVYVRVQHFFAPVFCFLNYFKIIGRKWEHLASLIWERLTNKNTYIVTSFGGLRKTCHSTALMTGNHKGSAARRHRTENKPGSWRRTVPSACTSFLSPASWEPGCQTCQTAAMFANPSEETRWLPGQVSTAASTLHYAAYSHHIALGEQADATVSKITP